MGASEGKLPYFIKHWTRSGAHIHAYVHRAGSRPMTFSDPQMKLLMIIILSYPLDVLPCKPQVGGGGGLCSMGYGITISKFRLW